VAPRETLSLLCPARGCHRATVVIAGRPRALPLQAPVARWIDSRVARTLRSCRKTRGARTAPAIQPGSVPRSACARGALQSPDRSSEPYGRNGFPSSSRLSSAPANPKHFLFGGTKARAAIQRPATTQTRAPWQLWSTSAQLLLGRADAPSLGCGRSRVPALPGANADTRSHPSTSGHPGYSRAPRPVFEGASDCRCSGGVEKGTRERQCSGSAMRPLARCLCR
jgi:hypothetical protein